MIHPSNWIISHYCYDKKSIFNHLLWVSSHWQSKSVQNKVLGPVTDLQLQSNRFSINRRTSLYQFNRKWYGCFCHLNGGGFGYNHWNQLLLHLHPSVHLMNYHHVLSTCVKFNALFLPVSVNMSLQLSYWFFKKKKNLSFFFLYWHHYISISISISISITTWIKSLIIYVTGS